jgi:hypothetical protein
VCGWIWPTRVGCDNQSLTPHNNPAYASCVELPDGNYSLVPEAEEGGADVEL